MMRRFLLAFQFLTIFPVVKMENISEADVGGSSAFFPAVGAVQGVLTVLTAAACMKVFPVELANGLVILVMVIINGGLHLDGLADTFDAIASRKDREKKLEIMKDSTVGPFGVISIVLALLLKYLSLNAVRGLPPLTYHASLFLMPVFSRWTMVPAIFHAQSARPDGLGRIFIEYTGIRQLAGATACLLISLGAVMVFSNRVLDAPFQVSAFIPALPLLYIFCAIAVRFSNRNFGGMTGDTFGAVSEISEILFLLSVILWSQRYT
jgi:adenosylcobinamide-GDP ribazoletransferase